MFSLKNEPAKLKSFTNETSQWNIIPELLKNNSNKKKL